MPEIFRYPEISPVPGAPTTVLGIINFRGEVITVNDIRVMLGLPVAEVTDQTRIVLILVDSVSEIIINQSIRNGAYTDERAGKSIHSGYMP